MVQTIRNGQTIIPLADSESNAPVDDGRLKMEEPKRTEAYHQSRLGQILIRKGYLSPPLLDKAILSSKSADQRLGDYLVDHRMIARWQLRRALSSQSQVRLSVSLSMVLLEPVSKLLAGKRVEPLDSRLEILLKPLLTAGSASEFEFDPNQSAVEVSGSGLVQLRIATPMGELNFDGLRLKTDGATSYQNLSLTDIELSDARLFIRTIHNRLAPVQSVT